MDRHAGGLVRLRSSDGVLLWMTRDGDDRLVHPAEAAVVFGLGWLARMADHSEMAVVYGATRERQRPPVAYVVVSPSVRWHW